MIEKRKKWSADIVNLSMLSYMVWLLLPCVQTYTHAVTGVVTIIFFGVGVLLDGVTFRRNWLTFTPRVLIAAALPLILILFLDRGGSAKAGFYVQQCMFWFPLIWCAYARMQNDPRIYRWIFPAFLVLVFITLITTTFWLIMYFLTDDPSFPYARLLGNNTAAYENARLTMMRRNIGGYNFIYMSVLLLPIVAYKAITSRGWHRTLVIGFYILLVLMIILSMYSIAIIFSFAITAVELISVLLRKLIKRLSVPLSFVCTLPFFLLLFLFRQPLAELALQVTTQCGLSTISYNLQSIVNAMNSDTASFSRIALYKVSIDSFLRSPWFGAIFSSEIAIGNHSELLDMLAGLGILGFAGFAAGVWVIGRKSATGIFSLSKNVQPHLWLQWLVFLMLFSVNTVFYSREIPLVLSLCIVYVLQSENRLALSSPHHTRTL